MATSTKIVPCLWFATEAEEAATYYVSIFKNAKITKVTHYSAVGQEIHGQPPGSVLTAEFELDGQPFTALNGGPVFKFNEAVSLQIMCSNQEEVDHYWNRLSEGGDPASQQCGWLKDKYGLSWQVVPTVLIELLGDQQTDASKRTMAAMMKMKKLDIEQLKRAYAG